MSARARCLLGMQLHRLVERRIALPRRAQDVGGQPPVARAGFYQVEGPARGSAPTSSFVGRTHVSALENPGHLSDLHFEQLAEQWTHVDAGKKIAARPVRRAARA